MFPRRRSNNRFRNAVAWLWLGACGAWAQDASKKLNVAGEIASLRAGVVTPYGLEFLAESKAVEAIPALEERFGLVSDDLDKGKIAQVLIRLKDPKPVYWAYLEKLVRSALDSDPPDPFDVDAQGRETGISPRIEEWARATRQAPPAALENATAVYPTYVVLLGGTEDRRAIPLLNRALLSRDHLIQAEAAEGLALFGDKASIPLILEACRKAPARAAGLIAASLVYFDDAEARAAVDQFLPEKEARDLRERVRAGGRPLHQ